MDFKRPKYPYCYTGNDANFPHFSASGGAPSEAREGGCDWLTPDAVSSQVSSGISHTIRTIG